MIRRARPADVPALLDMARRFHVESGYGDKPFVRDHLLGLLHNAVLSPGWCVLIAEQHGAAVGMLIATAADHPLAPYRMAFELAWWMAPEARGSRDGIRLLDEHEKWARETGCRSICISTIPALTGAQRVLEARGYRVREIAYGKDL